MSMELQPKGVAPPCSRPTTSSVALREQDYISDGRLRGNGPETTFDVFCPFTRFMSVIASFRDTGISI